MGLSTANVLCGSEYDGNYSTESKTDSSLSWYFKGDSTIEAECHLCAGPTRDKKPLHKHVLC